MLVMMLVMIMVMIMVTMMVMMVVMMMMKMMMREHKYFPSMACLIDVCLGGKGFAAEGPLGPAEAPLWALSAPSCKPLCCASFGSPPAGAEFLFLEVIIMDFPCIHTI